MSTKTVAFVAACLVAVLFGYYAETASAQPFRRPLRRILDRIPGGEYRVGPEANQARGPLLREPLIQGDGRFLERAQNVVGLLADGSAAERELKPVIVVSLSSFEDYKTVIQTVARKIRESRGSGEEPRILNDFLELYGRLVGQGFDRNQPIGIVLQTDGMLYYPLIFTPMDLDGPFGKMLKNQYATQLPDGRHVLRPEVFNWPLGQLFLLQHNGWAFIATERQLAALPDDPTVLLQGLDREALMAARFDLANLPPLTTRAALSLSEMQAVAQVETNIEKAMARLGMGYIRSLAEQADFLEYTLSYDEENNDYVIQQTEIAKPNTERVRLLQKRRDAESPFHGFFHPTGAMFASHFVMDLTALQREQLEIVIDEALGKHLLTEEERNILKPTASAEKTPRRRVRRQTAPAATPPVIVAPLPGPTLAPPQSAAVPMEEPTIVPTEVSAGDHRQEKNRQENDRDRLAQLLARTTPQEVEKQFEALPTEPTPTSEIVLSEEKGGTDPQKLEQLIRRVYVCYYWALIGSVRSGHFDGAATASFEQGFLSAYNIVEGEKFLAAFDSVFAEFERHYPQLYAQSVRKDYLEIDGFRLTALSFYPRDFLDSAPWGQFIPPEFGNREVRIVFAVRGDTVAFAVGEGQRPEDRLLSAIAAMEHPQPVHDMFFWFSSYEIGQAIAWSGELRRFPALKTIAAGAHPDARAYAVSEFTDTTKTLTLRISGLMTPSIWRLRDNFHYQNK